MNYLKAGTSPFKIRFISNLKSSKMYLILNFFLQIAAMPLFAAVSNLPKNNEYIGSILSSVAGISFTLSMIITVLTVFSIFSYLHNKTDTDMIMALPVSKSQLFMADFQCGLTISLTPVIIASVIASVIIFVSPGSSLNTQFVPFIDDILCFTGIYRPADIDPVTAIPLTVMLNIFLQIILSVIMLYVFTVLVTVCCGNKLEVFMYNAISNAVVLLFCICINSVPGLSLNESYSGDFTYEAQRLCPAGGFLHTAVYINHYISTGTLKTGLANWCIWTVIFILIYFSSAFSLFIKRKSEDASKPFVYPGFFYIISNVITVTVSITVYCTGSRIFTALLLSLVIFGVLVFIRNRENRNPKNFLKPAILYICSFAISVAVCTASEKTNGFGITYKVPRASQIAAASIYFENPYHFFADPNCMKTFTDTESIKNITELNEDLMEELNFLWNQDQKCDILSHEYTDKKYGIPAWRSGNTVRIRYSLKNGKISDRVFITGIDYTKYPAYYTPEADSDFSYKSAQTEKPADCDLKMLFIGHTSFADKVAEEDYSVYTGSGVAYPLQYRITDFDEDIFRELSYISERIFYSDEDCYTLRCIYPSENSSGLHVQFFIPPEYSELCEKFMQSGRLEELEWEEVRSDDLS